MDSAWICDAVRTPIGKYGGSLSAIRPDNMAATILKSILERNKSLNPEAVDDVILGCANQAGEDNRNVARMSLLLSGMPVTVPGVTVNRLCGSGMEAIGMAARKIMTGEAGVIIAGGVESMSRSPFVIEKSAEPFSRSVNMYDTTLGWRFPNGEMERLYGTESMMQTAENIASDLKISREDQDRYALNSQLKALSAQKESLFNGEIIPVSVPQRKGDDILVEHDEHPRSTSLEKLASLKPLTGKDGTITAGNASGVNDGASALIIASTESIRRYNLNPVARIMGMAVAGVPPRIMGLGPVPATKKLFARLSLKTGQIDIIELNEAFAAQALGCIREMGLKDEDERINRWGGAIALGHPLGMSGARLVTTALHQLVHYNLHRALCTMCIGVGQGIAVVIERA